MNSRKTVQQFLETEKAFGLDEIPSPKKPSQVSYSDKKAALEALRDEFKDCQLCALARTRTRLVFGDGSPYARLVFVGEAPGFDEDQQGLPFVGAAGQLLTKIIHAMKLKREEVYIANCLKCRPPQNRNPFPEEIKTCSPILLRQIQIIQPKIICALGKFAAQTLLNTEEPISRLRGRFFSAKNLGGPAFGGDFRDIKIIPTFHPAYLLRNPGDKKLVWGDMQKIMAELKASP